ncbi:MAG: Yip1 family protein [Anaerolineaceae bacterium]|nr:Yip1 family protein [Anaerolineaceae bacterium]
MKTKKETVKTEPTAALKPKETVEEGTRSAAPVQTEPQRSFPDFSEISSAPEEESIITPPRKRKERQVLHWAWIPGFFLRPLTTIRQILEDEKPVWLLPMLLLTLMVVVNVVLSGPAQRMAIQSGLNTPQDFQFWTQEEQQRYMTAQQSKSGPVFIYLFPILSGVAGWWFIWVLTSSILHLMITLAGSRTARIKASNLVAWAMLPFALGLLIKGIAVMASGRLLAPAPFAALISAEATGFMVFLRSVLGMVDAYWLWHAIILLLGAQPLSKLAKGKALGAVLAVIFIMLILQGLPGVIGGVLGNMSGARSFI